MEELMSKSLEDLIHEAIEENEKSKYELVEFTK